MKQALPGDTAEEKTSLQASLASLYPQLLHIAYGHIGENTFLKQEARRQAETARTVGQALRQLQRGLTGEREFAGASYFSRPEFLRAYLLYYWPVSFLQTSLALTELMARGVLSRPGSVLDLGAGPGPASAAAMIMGADTFLLLDKSREALNQALTILQAQSAAMKSARKTAATFSTSLADLENLKTLPQGPFDLILACHSVNELWKQDAQALDKRAALFGQAVERLSEGGLLIIIEPSAIVTSRPALALRDRLLSEFEGVLRCVAPCPGSYPCPVLTAGQERSCHSTWAWSPYEPISALAAAAGLDRDSVKATWFALQKTGNSNSREGARGQGRSDLPPAAASPIALSGSGLQPAWLEGRIISEAMLNKAGRLRYILCTNSGLASFSAKAKESAAETAGFFSLQRGDMITASALERREGQNSFGFVPGSKLSIAIKAPKA